MLANIMHLALVAIVWLAPLAAAPADAGAQRRLLLLHNGEVVEGNISRADDYYIVELSYGQIRVKISDVELICIDIEDGYRQKRAAIRVGNAQHHLELARWCLRHDLFGPAAVELADATIADPDNPLIVAMRYRLKMAMAPPSPSADGETAPPGPSNAELDRLVRNLPYKAVEYFTQSVQPVLMNNCMGSGCHGPFTETPMRLFRVSKDKSPSRRMTQRNLHSLLQFIDRENPAESPLVKACSGPHGDKQKSVFAEGQEEQQRRIVIWALLLAHQPAADQPATVSRPPQAPGDAAAQADDPSQTEDPFDPEVFNRRHAPPADADIRD